MKNRKLVEEKIYKTLSLLDPTNKNTNKYKELFKKMNDKQFIDYFKAMKNDDNNNFFIEMDLFEEGKNKISLDSIKESADYIKVPLEEYVYIKHRTPDNKPVRSAYKVPVLYLHLKKMQQILSKKNIVNFNTMGPGARSRITGALSDKEKAGRLTDSIELYWSL